jgi:hypothetical protein
MLKRNALLMVAGAAIFALDASVGTAQDTTKTRPRATSTKRIPVAKEVGGEVVTPRVDTVTVYRTDTLSMPGRVDTVSSTSTIVRVDTVLRPMPLMIRQVGGFYMGLAAGSSLPAAMFNDSDHPGWRVELPFGIDPIGSPLGVRFNLGYSRYEPHSYIAPVLNQAQLMNADADLKVRFISVTPRSTRIQLYALGGGTYNRFKDILEQNHGIYNIGNFSTGSAIPTDPSQADHAWHNGFGWNAGGGVEIGKGATNLFLEGRFNRFSGENSTISHVPVVIGLSWY